MIKGSQLDNRAELTSAAAKPDDPAALLAELRRRIEAARITRQGEEQHCADCFRRGRDAALKILDGQ